MLPLNPCRLRLSHHPSHSQTHSKMSRINAASVLLLLMAVAGAAHAQFMPPMQPLLGMPAMVFPAMKIPEGAQVATATAFANGTGTATSFSSNNNGVTTGYTQSSGQCLHSEACTSLGSCRRHITPGARERLCLCLASLLHLLMSSS